ncbi:MAG: uracil phosphoribosyltransferase [Finegoldia sp.]|nr:uracil phosphoribosyltransferase [Finegoldia sp.]
MSKVTVFDHPLIQHKISILRDKNTSSNQFRGLVKEISALMSYEITRDYELEDYEVETPICKTIGKTISGKKVAIIPILRAGLGMVDGFLDMIPSARVGHIGMYRDPQTLKPVEYYCKLPNDIAERNVIVVDPMLATGGSASDAISQLKEYGANNIRLSVLIASPQGVKTVSENHPDVDIFIGALDEGLNENSYIVPGLGDAGDRLFGTK